MELNYRTFMSAPVGKQAHARVLVEGPVTAKALRSLIRMLKLDLEILEDGRVPVVEAPIEETPK